jgi:hypothetical protein
MNFISGQAVNKRAQLYNIRPNKVANGWCKHYGSGKVPDKFLKVAVHGTFDRLAKSLRFDIIKVSLRHPTDSGYSKTTYILKKNKSKYKHIIV